MSFQLSILGWKAEGLRCPDHSVSLEIRDGVVHPIAFVQMPNGTGKTTTLELIRLAITGSGDRNPLSKDQVLGLKKQNSQSYKGKFELYLHFNTRRTTIILDFDFEEGTISYYTSTVGIGKQPGFKPPTDLQQLLRPDFANFIVIDGELPDRFLKADYADAQEIIEHLFQLNLMGKLSSWADTYWNFQTTGRNVRSASGLTAKQNQRTKILARINVLEQERDTLEKRNKILSDELGKLKKSSEELLKKKTDLNDAIHKAHEKYLGVSNQRKSLSEKILEEIRYPNSISETFGRGLLNFKESLDKLKLPENSAREFFEELAQAKDCICGRELTDEFRAHIKMCAQDYLGGDEQILINHIKGEITKHVGQQPNVAADKLTKAMVSLKGLLKDEGLAKQGYDLLKDEAGQEDPDFAEKERKRKENEAEIVRNNERLRELAEGPPSKDISTASNIGHLKKRYTDLEKEIADISGTVELKKKIDVLRFVLAAAQRDARVKINAEITKKANERIQELMPSNRIQISKIDKCLHLVGQSSGSAGENLSIAYSYLSSLFHRSDFQLPFVVDSPVIPLDRTVRKNLSKIIGHLGHQYIGFTISTEQDFVNFVRSANEQNVAFCTLFRSRLQAEAAAAKKVKGHIESADGILVPGYDFFNSFQLVEDDAD